MPDVTDPGSAPQSPLPVFAERFALGVSVGAGTVSVGHVESWWAASLTFAAFVLFLLLRWQRLVTDPWIDQ